MTFIPDLQTAALTLQADLYPDTHAQHIIGELMNRITYLEQACDDKDRLNRAALAELARYGGTVTARDRLTGMTTKQYQRGDM